VRELSHILKPDLFAGDIGDHLIALREYGYDKSDFLVGRYRAPNWGVQVIYSGHATGLLFVPSKRPKTPQASPEYALSIARRVFVDPRKQYEARIRAGGGPVGPLVHGGIMNPGWDSGPHSPVGPGPWYGSEFVTDGSWAFLLPFRWGLREGIDTRKRAAPPEAPPVDRQILLLGPG